MQKKYTKILINIFYSLTNEILTQSEIKPLFGYIIITLRFLLLIPTLINPDNLLILKNIDIKNIELINILLPYKLIKDYSIYICIGLSFCFLAIILFLIIFLRKIYKKNLQKKYLNLFGNFLYIFEYIISPIILGLIINFFFNDKSISDIYTYIFSVIFFFAGIIFFTLWILLTLFYFNFFLESKDVLSRFPCLFYIGLRIYLLIIIFFDIFLVNEHKDKIMIILNFINFLLLFSQYLLNITYYNYNMNVYYGFLIIFYFWINLIYIFGKLIIITMIQENGILLFFIGFAFLIWTIMVYRNYFFYKLLTMINEDIKNPNYFDKRIRYFIFISNDYENNKNNELLLISILQSHVQICKDVQCCCKKRKNNIGIFKDKNFIKNLILGDIKNKVLKNPYSHIIRINYIIYLLEKNTNFASLNEEIRTYEKIFKNNLPIFYEFCIKRIKKKFKKKLNEYNLGIDPENFQKIKKYDIYKLNIEKSITEIINQLEIFWMLLKEKNYKVPKIEKICNLILKNKKLIEELFEKIQKIKDNNKNMYLIINFFYEKILDDPIISFEYMKKIKVR